MESLNIMRIDSVRDKYRQGWYNRVRKNWRGQLIEPDEIVIHGTAGGHSVDGLVAWMNQGARAANYRRGISLFHYAIGRNGDIGEILDPDFYVYHSSSGKHDKKTIGIELLNPSKSNREPYTEEQYAMLFNVIFYYLMVRYPSITKITSHKYNAIVHSGKRDMYECPGAFEWTRLREFMDEREMEYTVDGNLHYNIRRR